MGKKRAVRNGHGHLISLLFMLLTALSTAASGQSTNELVLPIVVNGAVADEMHYQTIFTILNASRQEISATLQIYSKAGTPAGVFCSPLAPPPSSVTTTLRPITEPSGPHHEDLVRSDRGPRPPHSCAESPGSLEA